MGEEEKMTRFWIGLIIAYLFAAWVLWHPYHRPIDPAVKAKVTTAQRVHGNYVIECDRRCWMETPKGKVYLNIM